MQRYLLSWVEGSIHKARTMQINVANFMVENATKHYLKQFKNCKMNKSDTINSKDSFFFKQNERSLFDRTLFDRTLFDRTLTF